MSSTDLDSNTIPAMAQPLRFADIGINFTDPIFRGVYHGKQAHENDLKHVIARAVGVGCSKMLVTGSSLEESQKAIEMAKEYPETCYATVGIHPCQANDFLPPSSSDHPPSPSSLPTLDSPPTSTESKTLSSLRSLLTTSPPSSVLAYGEFGLDYDRLHFSSQPVQLRAFQLQLSLAIDSRLPLFLHSRNAAQDFERILRPHLDSLLPVGRRGVVHSFTGTLSEMQSILFMGFDVGVNGCSLKTIENLNVVRQVPLDRLQLETDGPWCDIRPTHASHQYLSDYEDTIKRYGEALALPKPVKKEKWSEKEMVKGRNEPCTIVKVAHVVAKIKGLSIEEVCDAAWKNSVRMFGFGKDI